MEKKTINLGRVGFAPKGAYSPEVTYGRMHVVTYKNTTYWSKQEDNLNHEPNGETEWWGVLVDGQAAYSGANDAVKATERANTAAEKADAATEKANSATSKAVAATDTVNAAVTNANDATAKAKKAAEVCEAIVPVEDARVKAESSRVEAESSRVSAEQSRAVAEQSRGEAESQRTAAEAKRNTDELSRQSNETDRKEAEAARVEAEQGRVDAENQRSASEEARSTAESGRVTAENARVAAENSRVSAEQTREQSFTAKVGEVDTAIKNCNTATQGAEKVDAVLGDDKILTITSREGVTKKLDISASEKAATSAASKANTAADAANTAASKADTSSTEVNKYMDIVKLPVVEVAASGDAVALDANKVYVISVGETLTLTLNAPTDTSVCNEYQGSFDTGSTAPSVTFPADVSWAETPSVDANQHIEFNIRYTGGKYYGLIQTWDITTEE